MLRANRHAPGTHQPTVHIDNLISYLVSSKSIEAERVPVPDQIARSNNNVGNNVSRRRLYILLLLAVVLFAQSAALLSEHQHHHATEHCCLLCHVGLPFIQASAPATVAPLTSVQWLAASPHFESFYDLFLSSSSSRGPPVRG
jgi:hypothetical protein